MWEIGCLCEIVFCVVGEGINKCCDIDIYDSYYYYLVLWDEVDLEIVGVYWFGDV